MVPTKYVMSISSNASISTSSVYFFLLNRIGPAMIGFVNSNLEPQLFSSHHDLETHESLHLEPKVLNYCHT